MSRYPTIDQGCSARGADMGRSEWDGMPEPATVRLFRLPLDTGGYDPGGAYWGQGEPIYCATDGTRYRRFLRAHNRDAAIAKLALPPELYAYPAPESDMQDMPMILRRVKLEASVGRPFFLKTWDAERHDAAGRWAVGYELTDPTGAVIFHGADIWQHDAVDSDEALRTVIFWLTLRPGDTDPEHFEQYTPDQLRFAQEDAEWLSIYTETEEPLAWEELPTEEVSLP